VIPCVARRCGLVVAALAWVVASPSGAAEFGPSSPGGRNVRDFFVPQPGFYLVAYSVYYTSDTLTDSHGNEVKTIDVTPPSGKSIALDFHASVDLFVLAPTVGWIAPWDIAGGRFGVLITPTFGNSSGHTSLKFEDQFDRDTGESQFGVGDLYVQPVWLGWSLPHWDLELAYGFSAPVGKYDVETVSFPRLGLDLERPAYDNIGSGFWTNQFQGGATLYPFDTRATGIAAAVSYALHGERSGLDVTPGSTVELDWAITQYLPLAEEDGFLVDLGPVGFSQWQVTDDTGSGAENPSRHGQVSAAGGEIGLGYVPWAIELKVRYTHEFGAESRFEGQTFALSLGTKL